MALSNRRSIFYLVDFESLKVLNWLWFFFPKYFVLLWPSSELLAKEWVSFLSEALPSHPWWLQALCADGALAAWLENELMLSCCQPIGTLCAIQNTAPVPITVTVLQVPSPVSRVKAGLDTFLPPEQSLWTNSTKALRVITSQMCLAILPKTCTESSSTKPLSWTQEHLHPNPGWNCMLSIPCPVGTLLYRKRFSR